MAKSICFGIAHCPFVVAEQMSSEQELTNRRDLSDNFSSDFPDTRVKRKSFQRLGGFLSFEKSQLVVGG